MKGNIVIPFELGSVRIRTIPESEDALRKFVYVISGTVTDIGSDECSVDIEVIKTEKVCKVKGFKG